MKKILAILLALVMVLALVACQPSDSKPTDGATTPVATDGADDTAAPTEETLEPVTLRMWFHGSTVTPDASATVMEAVNAYLGEKLNVTLEPIWGTWGDFDEATKTALAGGDDVDIYFT